MAAIDVLNDQVDLTPQRYLPHAAEASVDPALILATIDDFGRLIDDVRRSLPLVRKSTAEALHAASHADAQVATPEQVGAELAPGVQLLRVDKNLFDPWFVAGILSRTDNVRVAGRASSSGSGALRIDIRRLAIPVVPLEQQRAYGEAFQRLAEFRTGLGRVAAAGNALARDIGDALTSGVLTITP
ncbi:hypothetical protein [Micromonospora humida]|uniref:hypothetical protein n=1 Tax=Micromonospora humida TaxID=2809018 RepID=UPI00341B7808